VEKGEEGIVKQIYIMQRQDGAVKVGISGDPKSRRQTVQAEVGQSVQLCASSFPRDDARRIEALSHKMLLESHAYGEWFWVTVREAQSAIEKAVDIHEGRIPDTVSDIYFFPIRDPNLPMVRLNIAVDLDMLEKLDQWREMQGYPIPSRSAAVRTILLDRLCQDLPIKEGTP
jgi:hypothetical protein